MQKLLLISVVLVLGGSQRSYAAEVQACRADGAYDPFGDARATIDPAYVAASELQRKEILKAGIPAHCLETTDSALKEAFGKNTKEKLAWLNFSTGQIPLSWDTSLYPAEEAKLAAFFGPIRSDKLTQQGSIQALRKWLASPPDLQTSTTEVGDLLTAMPEFFSDRSIQEAKKSLTLLCATYSLKLQKPCAAAMEKTVERMQPVRSAGFDWTLSGKVHDVLTDSKYVDGAVRAAEKILGHVENKNPTPTHLFEDVKESYREAGMSEADAENATWEILAVISTRGANIGGALAKFKLDPPRDRLPRALHVIAAGAAVLDHRTLSSGHPYSYPKEVTTHCNYAKSYHFWMTAYLAREAALEQKNPQIGEIVGWLFNQGYQARSQTVGRDPLRFFSEEVFSTYNNSVRIDLGFSSAGARFGAATTNGTVGTYDIDRAITAMIEDAKPESLLTRDEANALWTQKGPLAYLRWKRIIAPDSAFRSYEEEE